MGRPTDEFLWNQVDGTWARWVCKHCHEEFVGCATWIRNHLSGAGNDIPGCAVVPSHIRDKALKKNTRKRRPSSSVSPLRVSSSSTAAAPPPPHDPPPSSSNNPDAEQYVIKAFMKLLMTIGVSDAINYPTVREFLERAHQHGVPLSLLGNDPFIIERPLQNIKHEVEQYMLMVKESWKTTGCTMITYNLSEKKENFAGVERMDVIGFYCPKGFIFVRAPITGATLSDTILDYPLKKYQPSLELDDLVFYIHHQHHLTPPPDKNSVDERNWECKQHWSESDAPFCETSEHVCNLTFASYVRDFGFPCLRLQIRGACLEECDESEWANGLIYRAVRLHNLLLQANRDAIYEWYCKILAEKDEKMLDFVDEKTKIQEVHLSIFLLIMRLVADMQQLNQQKSYFGGYENPKIMAIVGEPTFWIEGRKLALVLTLTLRISDIMDTLVPTAGYLGRALHNVESVLLEFNKSSSCGITEADEAFHIWTGLRNRLKFCENSVLSDLDPRYFLQEENVNVSANKTREIILKCVPKDEEDKEAPQLRKDLACYRDVFRRFSEKIQLSNFHPVKLWEQYGHDLPLLQKCAIKLLSQPLTCMCNQVRKHIYQLQGRDDYILTLNVKMMEEFKILGDDIYNHPIDINAWEWIPAGLCTSEPKYA